MANGVVRWVMEVSGGAQVRQALRGLVAESRSADRATTASTKAASTERSRIARTLSRDMMRDARARVRTETDAEHAVVQAARDGSRERGRLRRAEERDARRNLRESRRQGQGGRGGALRAAGGVVAGVAQAAMGRVEGWSAALGAPTRDELIQRTLANQMTLIRATTGARMSGGAADQVFARVNAVARSTGTDTGELTEGLSIAQERFSALAPFAENLEQIALAARAVDAPIGDMVGAIGEFQRQLGVSSEEIPTLLGLMADGMNEGSLSAGDVAANFSSLMSTFTTLRGDAGRGVNGATEFLATSQALGASGAGPEGARVLMENMMSQLSRTDTQRELERTMHDRNLFNDRGQMQVSFGELVQRMADNPRMQNASVMQRVFGNDVQGARARNFLLEQTRTTGNPIEALMSASADRGNAFIGQVNQGIDASAAGQAMRIRANAEANFAENGDDLLQGMIDMVEPMAELTSEYPRATEALGFFRDAIGSVTGALGSIGLASLLGGGGTAAAGTAAASTAAGGGALGLGALAVPAAVGAGAFLGLGFAGQEVINRHNAVQDQDARNRLAAYTDEVQNSTPEMMQGRESRESRQGRELGAAGARMDRMPTSMRIDDTSISAFANAMARASDRGAPASGRTPTEPGRRQ